MNVGIPGTGIGGLFYLLSVFLILISEVISLVRGRRNRARWKVVIEQFVLTIIMVAMTIVTNYYLTIVLFKKRPVPLPDNPTQLQKGINLLQNHPILIPIVLLSVVLFLVQIAHGIVIGRRVVRRNVTVVKKHVKHNG